MEQAKSELKQKLIEISQHKMPVEDNYDDTLSMVSLFFNAEQLLAILYLNIQKSILTTGIERTKELTQDEKVEIFKGLNLDDIKTKLQFSEDKLKYGEHKNFPNFTNLMQQIKGGGRERKSRRTRTRTKQTKRRKYKK